MAIVKLTYLEETRRFELPALALPHLHDKAKALFGVEPGIKIAFYDEDRDLITIGTDEELRNAVESADGVVRFVVVAPQQPQPEPDHGGFWRRGGRHPGRGGHRQHGRGGWHHGHHGPPHHGPPHHGPPHHGPPHHGPPHHGPPHHGPHHGRWPHGPHGHHGPHHGPRHGGGGGGGRLMQKTSRKAMARWVKHVTLEDGTEVAPGTPFTKIWRVRNDAATPWPAKCELVFVGGEERMLPDGGDGDAPRRFGVEAASLRPTEVCDVAVELVAPSAPGRYTSYFKLKDADPDPALQGRRRFGMRLWCDIVVTEGGDGAGGVPAALGFSSSLSSDSESEDSSSGGGGGRCGAGRCGGKADGKRAHKLQKRAKKRAHKLEKKQAQIKRRRTHFERKAAVMRSHLAKIESRISMLDEKLRRNLAKQQQAMGTGSAPAAAAAPAPPPAMQPPTAAVAPEGQEADGFAVIDAAEEEEELAAKAKALEIK